MLSSAEIACDESGSEGEKLIGGNTEVFAHASVLMSVEAATAGIDAIRDRAPSPTLEYKSDVIRRKKHREALRWMLGTSGPLLGNTHVHLVDKAYFVVVRVVELLTGEIAANPPYVPAAVALHREGPDAFGRDRWTMFVRSFNNLLRAKPETSVESVYELVSGLAGGSGPADEIIDLILRARPAVESFLAVPRPIPILDPLIPAIVRAADYWSEGRGPVSIVHDRQTLLTEDRMALLSSAHVGRLAGVRLVASHLDPRVQIADLLAGAARMIAEDELNSRADPGLTALLRPYVDTCSIWGDERSWALLGPVPAAADRGPADRLAGRTP